jgi:hypothetical protein
MDKICHCDKSPCGDSRKTNPPGDRVGRPYGRGNALTRALPSAIIPHIGAAWRGIARKDCGAPCLEMGK